MADEAKPNTSLAHLLAQDEETRRASAGGQDVANWKEWIREIVREENADQTESICNTLVERLRKEPA